VLHPAGRFSSPLVLEEGERLYLLTQYWAFGDPGQTLIRRERR
jgi:hypothetical protein